MRGMNQKILLSAALAVLMAAGVAVRAAEEEKKPAAPVAPAESAPVKVDATKKDQIEGAMGKQAIVNGTVESTKWTKTGKTLIVMFKDAPDDFRVIAFGKNREELDKAFDGDIAKTLEGKQIEVTGKIRKYPGSVESWKKFTEIAVTKPEQIKVVEQVVDKK